MIRSNCTALAAAILCLSGVDTCVRAGPITGYPAATTPLTGTEVVLGDQGGTVKITAASIGAIAKPGGSSGALQYNSGGVLGGASQLVYCTTCFGGGPLFALTAPTQITNQSWTLINGSSVSWLIGSATAGGGQLFLSLGSNINWANNAGISEVSAGVLGIGSGAQGDFSGVLKLGEMHAYSQFELTDGSNNVIHQFTSTAADIHTNLILHPGASNNLYPTTPLGGAATISLGRQGSGQGLNISGSASGNLFCDPISAYCMGRQMDYWSSDDGFEIFGVETGVSDHHGLELGLTRDANDMQHIAQLLPLDRVSPPGAAQHFNITNGGSGYTHATATLTGTGCTRNPSSAADVEIAGGAVTGVSIHYDPGQGCSAITVAITGDGTGATATTTLTTGATDASVGPDLLVLHASGALTEPAWWGFGQADLGLNRIRFGGTIDSGHPWATAAIQPTLTLSGPLEWDTPNAGVEAGFTNDFSIRDVSGMMSVTKWDNSAAAPIKVSFTRPVPTTVSGLATADASPADGDSAFVTDANACTFMSPVTGGGSTHCPVHYDGSSLSWKAG